jgi:homoserine kinase type II
VAVFTPVTVEEAQGHLRLYDGLGDVASLTGVAEGVENTNYRLETTEGVYALTLFEKRVDPDALPFYLGLMEHLAANGVPAPMPQRMRSGEMVGVLNARAAAIVEWLPGAWLSARPGECSAKCTRRCAASRWPGPMRWGRPPGAS